MSGALTLLDNDVLIKGSAYSLWGDVTSTAVLSTSIGVLGAARFVVPKAIEGSERIIDRDAAMSAWLSWLEVVSQLEPTDEELRFATELEDAANELGLALDVGESQLCAMAVHRPGSLLLTGDKRALAAAEELRSFDHRLAPLDGQLACLEQLVHELLTRVDPARVRGRICAEPAVDKALSICFSCSSPVDVTTVDDAGLVSYINNLRASAPTILTEGLAS